MPKKKKEYSVELIRLLEFLKTNNPTPVQHRKFKELNQGERKIYMAAVKRKANADRKKLFKLMKRDTYAK